MSESRTPDEWIAHLREGMRSPSAIAEAERAPTPLSDALELLRATGCPIGRKAKTGQAA